MASETTAATNTIRQNEHPYLKKRKQCIVLFTYFLIKKLYLKSYLFGSKIGINALTRWIMRGGAYTRGRAYTWSNTSVKEKMGLFAEGPMRGGLIGGEIRYVFHKHLLAIFGDRFISIGMIKSFQEWYYSNQDYAAKTRKNKTDSACTWNS